MPVAAVNVKMVGGPKGCYFEGEVGGMLLDVD